VWNGNAATWPTKKRAKVARAVVREENMARVEEKTAFADCPSVRWLKKGRAAAYREERMKLGGRVKGTKGKLGQLTGFKGNKSKTRIDGDRPYLDISCNAT
jgi:hypothetical protein